MVSLNVSVFTFPNFDHLPCWLSKLISMRVVLTVEVLVVEMWDPIVLRLDDLNLLDRGFLCWSNHLMVARW